LAKTKKIEKEEVAEDNVVRFEQPKKFEVLPGGKGPETANWLADLPVGTAFLTRHKPQGMNREVAAAQFLVTYHTEKCTRLLDNMNDREMYFWVITQDFSRANECVEVIGQVHPAKTEEPEEEEK
jgi:hypothetical protein